MGDLIRGVVGAVIGLGLCIGGCVLVGAMVMGLSEMFDRRK